MISRIPRVASAAIVLVAALWGVASPQAVRAADSGPLADKVAGSLAFVPEDVSFYSASLRMREQVDIFLASNVWARIKALPSVQQVWQRAQEQWTSGPLAPAAQLMTLPENEELLELLGDLASQEMFVYGDQQLLTLIDLMNEANNANRAASIVAAIQFNNGNFDTNPSTAQARAILDTLADNLDALSLPTLVMGFKAKDVVTAKRQIKRLEVMARMTLAQVPQLRVRFERKKLGEGDYLTLALDGSLIPWEEYDIEEFAAEPGQYDALIEKLKNLTLSISIGVYKDFVILSLSKSNEHLASLGSTELLARSGHLDPVARAAGERLTSVGYISEAMMGRLQGRPEDIDELGELVEELLDELDLDDDVKEPVLKDVEALSKDLKQLIPQPGVYMGYSFLTPRGVESYGYDHSQNQAIDGSRPLDLLDHVGGSPLAALVTRAKVSVDQYKMLVKWLKVGWGYVDKFAVPKMSDSDKKEFEAAVEAAKPLLARLNQTTIDKLFPALADGQVGLVLDGKWKSKQWIKAAPETAEAFVIPELALALGVSDAKLLKSALTDYQAIADEAVEAARKLHPEDIPAGFKLPHPTKTSTTVGETFVYTLPAEAGLDPQITPNFGVGERVFVASLSLPHTSRLLASTPFQGSGALADAKQPLATALVWNFSGTVDAATPWIELAVANYGPGLFAAMNSDDSGDADPPVPAGKRGKAEMGEIVAQFREGMKLLGSLKTITSGLRIDKDTGVLIRHTELHFQDAP